MTLRDDALKLAEALEDTVSNLERYGLETKSEYEWEREYYLCVTSKNFKATSSKYGT